MERQQTLETNFYWLKVFIATISSEILIAGPREISFAKILFKIGNSLMQCPFIITPIPVTL
jgi:hypothetical protein